MSRIPSFAQRAVNTVRQAAEEGRGKAEEARAQVEQAWSQAQQAGGQAAGLYNAGAARAGRDMREVREWRGGGSEVRGQTSAGEYWDSRFAGAEVRAFAQRSASTVAAGVDGLAGYRSDSFDTDGITSTRAKVMAGIEGHAAAFAGAATGISAGVTAGLRVAEKTTTREPGVTREQTAHLLYGAVVEVQGQVGTVIGGKLDVFAGARGGRDGRTVFTNPDGSERFGVGARGRGMMGVGVMVDGEAGYDVETHQTRVSAGAGLALGVGLYGGGELTVGGDGSDD